MHTRETYQGEEKRKNGGKTKIYYDLAEIIGVVMIILGFLGGVAAFYFGTTFRLNALAEENTKQEVSIVKNTEEQKGINKNITELQSDVKYIKEDVNELKNNVERIRTEQEKSRTEQRVFFREILHKLNKEDDE